MPRAPCTWRNGYKTEDGEEDSERGEPELLSLRPQEQVRVSGKLQVMGVSGGEKLILVHGDFYHEERMNE